jgi:hypothetical protein
MKTLENKYIIDITPLENKYIFDGWDKLVSFEDFLNIQKQKDNFNSCAIGIETEGIKDSF